MPDTGVSIRIAGPDDLAVVGALTVAAYAAGGGLALGAADPYADVLRDPASRPAGTTVLVAVDRWNQEGPLGAVTYIPPGSSMAQISRDGEAEIRMLAVAPDQQGRGIATALILAAVDRAGGEGRPAVVLCVVSTNTGARSLYERLDFIRIPDRDWSPVPDLVLLGYRRGDTAELGAGPGDGRESTPVM